MNLNTLNEFRHGVYGSFGKARDALFNLMDALASEASARSFPELSFPPFFERSWASLYEALEDGRIDAERLRDVFRQFAPLPEPGQLVFLGIDTSNLYRPEAETAADRTLVKIATLPADTHVASPGWVISSVVLLPSTPGQGTFVLDTVRVTSSELATEAAARQLYAVVAMIPFLTGNAPTRWPDAGSFCQTNATVIGQQPGAEKWPGCCVRVCRPWRGSTWSGTGRPAKKKRCCSCAPTGKSIPRRRMCFDL